MDLWTLQAITIIAMFLTNFASFLLPARFTWKDKDTLQKPGLNVGINLANCFSAGVFIGTFFVGLLPEVRKEFDNALLEIKADTTFPVAEFVVVMGFFLSLFVEHLVVVIREGCNSRNKGVVYSKAPTVDAPLDNDEVETFDRATQNNNNQTTKISEESEADFCDSRFSDHEHNHHEIVGADDGDAILLLNSEDGIIELSQNGHTHHSHAHGHSHDIDSIAGSQSGIRLIVLILSMGLHSVFEGVALGLQTRIVDLVNLFIGVIIHECLISFAIGVSLSKRKLNMQALVQYSILFSLTIPIGQIVGILIGTESNSSSLFTTSLQAIAAGTFIHATFLEVLPEGMAGPSNKGWKLFFLLLGFFVIAGVTAIFHDHSHH